MLDRSKEALLEGDYVNSLEYIVAVASVNDHPKVTRALALTALNIIDILDLTSDVMETGIDSKTSSSDVDYDGLRSYFNRETLVRVLELARASTGGRAPENLVGNIKELRLAATLLLQARDLCNGALNLLGDRKEDVAGLHMIENAIGEQCIQIERSIAGMKGPHTNKVSSDKAAAARHAEPTRIEQLHAELLECERLNSQLDELSTMFDSTSSGQKTTEDAILVSDAVYAEKRLLDRIETLTNCLALERPTTGREILIFTLRALSPLQNSLMAMPDDEQKQGRVALKLLQGIIPALEELVGVTRAELGSEENQTEMELIENLERSVTLRS